MLTTHRSMRGQGGPTAAPMRGSSPLVAVAVDGDKNSHHALKWAADHVLSRGNIFVLLHVRRPSIAISAPIEQDVASAFLKKLDAQTQQVLLPFQCFCTRRGLICREVILDDMNISKAIVDFVLKHGVDRLVLGASKNSILRAFKRTDVPSSVSKIAPEYCSVYVISKGSISSARPATRPKANYFSGNDSGLEIAGNQFQSSKSDTYSTLHMDSPKRFALRNSAGGYGSKSGRALGDSDQRNYGRGFSYVGEPHGVSFRSFASCPSPSRSSVDKKSGYFPQALDGGRQQTQLSASSINENRYLDEQRKSVEFYKNAVGSSGYEPPTIEEAEDEIRRLKLQLKLAVDKYEDASKRSYVAKDDGDLLSERTLETNEKMQTRFSYQASERKMEFEHGKATEKECILLPEMGMKFSSDVKYKKYSIAEIKEATNNFSESLKIGEGAYGPVFKSTLDNIPVAIKIPRPDVVRGTEQFRQEVEVLSSIRHPNLVQLIGACPEYGCLVYDFMANGNLEDCIFCRFNTPPLSWQLRFKIAAEIASGLLYLHQTKPEPLVHRDLKPANILLDQNFVSKITDVGLSRLLTSSSSTSSSLYLATAAAGTFCYIDPEYQKTGTVGVKSDVYALGIILLQLITGRPAMGLAFSILSAFERGSFEEMLDPNVEDWPMEETVKLAKLGLMCAELHRRDRPDLVSVVVPELHQLRELADLSLEIGGGAR